MIFFSLELVYCNNFQRKKIQKKMSTLQQVKGLMQEHKYLEVIEAAQKLLDRDPVKNKAALLFLAQAHVQTDGMQESQNALNQLYSCLQVGSNKNDDTLYIQALKFNQKIAVKMQNESQNKQVQQAGREQQKTNQFKIVEFHDMKQQYDKMLEEMDTFLTILQTNEAFKEIEDNLMWLIEHQNVSPEKKIMYLAQTQSIDQYYNPYTKIEKAFNMALNLQGMQRPYSDEMVQLATKLLDFLERQNWRKDLHSAVNQLSQNKGAVEEFNRYCKSAVPASEIIFSNNPAQVLFKGNQSAIMHFIRAISSKTFKLQHGSEEWNAFVADLKKVTQMEVYQATIGDLESNPAQLMIHCILDIDHILQTSEVPDIDRNQELFFVKNFGDKENAHTILSEFSKSYKGYTPFVNLYTILCVTCLGWQGSQVPIDDAMTKLNLATFLQRKIFQNKLGVRNQSADWQVLACILNMRLAAHLSVEKRSETIEIIAKTMEQISQYANSEILTVYFNEQSQIQWKVHLAEGRWQDAILELEKVAEAAPAKATWVKIRVNWIQYSFIDRIAKDQDEKKLLLQNIFAQLQEAQAAQEKDAEALLMQGTMLFLQAGDINSDGKACLTKWLLALKRDQTNADTFYCLALYYLCREKQFAKAQKCLDKALLLRPDFEEAFLLNYCLLCQDGKNEAAMALVSKMQSINRNVASTYYLGGLAQLRDGNYIQAIDDLQNATRFYSIARSSNSQNRNSLRSVYPLPREIVKEHEFTLLRAKLGLCGSHEKQFVAVWMHLIQCFVKIDKPQVALKCFNRAMEEFATILPQHLSEKAEQPGTSAGSMSTYIKDLVGKIELIRNADRLQLIETNDQAVEAVVKTVSKINQVLNACEDQVPAILIECVECLTLGAQITQDQNFSIELAVTSLKVCQRVDLDNSLNIVETMTTLLLQRFTDKIQHSSLIAFGQVTIPVWISKQLELITQMIKICDSKFPESQPFQQAAIHALYAISQKTTQDVEKQKELLLDCFQRAEALIQRLQIEPDSQVVFGPCARSLLLDAAKIALKCENVGIVDQTISQKKLIYAKRAIMLDPENAELWVHLHLCLTGDTEQDKSMRAKSIFRAYQLDPELPFVQEHLLKHYFASPSTYSRAFHMILRTTQQQQAEQVQSQQQTTLPIITAVLAYLNARAYFSTGASSSTITNQSRKSLLLQAISLISLIEKRDDLIQLFQSLQVFLQHQKGDYLQTIKYLEHLCEQEGNELLKLMLVEAYLGVSIHNVSALKTKITEINGGLSSDAGNHIELLNEAKGYLEIQSNSENKPSDFAELKEKTEALIQRFKEQPRQVSAQLILLQELCLEQKILPDLNVLDLDEYIMNQVEQLELNDQRTLIIQCLQFCQIRDGEIAGSAKIQSGQTGEVEESKDANGNTKDYLRYLIKASRIKPQTIDSIQTHKDLLQAKLQTYKHPHMYIGHSLKQPENPKDRTYIGLNQLIKSLQQKLLFAQKELMKEPQSLIANVRFIMGLIYNSKMTDALKAFDLLKKRMQTPLIATQDATESDMREFKRLETIISDNQEDSKQKSAFQAFDQSVSSLCQTQKIKNENDDPEEFSMQMIDRIATGFVKAIVSTQRQKKQIMLISELSFLLRSLVFQQGQHQVFMRLIERMLQVVNSLPQNQQQAELLNVLWGFKCLNKTSALIELGKNASSTQEANLSVKVLRSGTIMREEFPGLLLQARAFQLARNENQALNALEQTPIDSPVIRDFIVALGLYAQQAYKQFYLAALGLVAGCKTQVEKTKDQCLGEVKLQSYFILAYAYYLKAFAECTFLAARRQNLILAEDFNTEDDGQDYNADYFRKMARSSLSKAALACQQARDSDGQLKQAIDFMQTQTY